MASAVTASGPEAPYVIYVDHAAPGANDGLSWHDALRDLQDALTLADALVPPVEIRVAQGRYTPDRGTLDRREHFRLRTGVAVFGGFAGAQDPVDPDSRDVAAFETILDGDLLGDDAAGKLNENSYHVVGDSPGTEASAILDGFTVRGGYSWAPFFDDQTGISGYGHGAGMLLRGGPTIRRCTIRNNTASIISVSMIISIRTAAMEEAASWPKARQLSPIA
jgi:hypothetical protein